MDYNTDVLLNEDSLLFIAAIIAVVYTISVLCVKVFIPFKKQRDYIKMEMKRSDEEQEYRYWRNELKKLYLQAIPLVGKLFR